MCVTFAPVANPDINRFLPPNTAPLVLSYPKAAWPGYVAPMIRQAEAGRQAQLAQFGLVPYWAEDPKIGKMTYNARSETVASKPSFRRAWAMGQFCLVPMQTFCEPKWADGKATRVPIGDPDLHPFAAAAIWDVWRHPHTGEEKTSFSLLTINADHHPLMRQFHRPHEEKRSIAIIPETRWQDWLDASPNTAKSLLGEVPSHFIPHAPATPPINRA